MLSLPASLRMKGGHGHHQASAILAIEAFKIAGDPKVYPEQLKYVKPWAAKRLLWNTFNFGDIKTTADNQFNLEIGDYNPLIGKSYGRSHQRVALHTKARALVLPDKEEIPENTLNFWEGSS